MASHVRKNDTVVVISGAHRGARGKALRVDRKADLVVIEGVNMVYRHLRPNKKNPKGGRIQKEAPIHLSNVLPYDQGSSKPSRVKFESEWDDHHKLQAKHRLLKRSGSRLNTLVRRGS